LRGCLFTLLLGAITIGLFIVLGLPAIAAGVLTAGVTTAGLQAGDTTVTVSSDPPTDLLGLHADRVHLTASDAMFRGLRIGSVDVTLAGMSLVDRMADAVDGRLRDVVLPDVGGTPLEIATVRLGGGGDEVTVSASVPGTRVEGLIADAVERELGTRPSAVSLSSPDRLTVSFGAKAPVEARFLVTPAGDLVARITSGAAKGREAVVIAADGLPFRLTDVAVTGSGDVQLDGGLSIGLFG
jgi:hypothetical protein